MNSLSQSSRRQFIKSTLAAGTALPFILSTKANGVVTPIAKLPVLSTPLTHSDWMLKSNIPWGPAGVKHMLDQCKEAGWTQVHWRVTDGGRSLYKSKLMRPMGKWDDDSFWNPQSDADKALFKRYYPHSDEQRRALLAKFDALDYGKFDCFAEAIRYGHSIGLTINAWITINEDDHAWGLQSEFAKKHPEFRWVKRSNKPYQSQLSFAFPEVRKYKLAIVKELLSNYDLDGIFLDWIRTGDVRDNPQTDNEGVADYGYEEPLVKEFRKKFKKGPFTIPNGDDSWVRFRAEPQTIYMRDLRKLLKKQKRKIPLSVMVGHPWHYRGELNKIDGNLRGLLLDVNTWAREGLMDAAIAAGYYRDGGNAEMAARALQKETESKVDVWNFAWVPNNAAEAQQSFQLAEKTGTKHILYWEADYIDDRGGAAPAIKAALQSRASK